MQRCLLFFLSGFYALVFLVNCTHSQIVVVVPVVPTQNECDTSNVIYSKDVLPILRSNCYICHSTDSVVARGSGLDLQDTASLKQYLSYGFRGDNLYGSKLYHCILHAPLALPMPPDYVLDTCSLKKIKKWINAGAPIN